MKRLNDYTEAELSALTDSQIDDLIDLECAFAGAPLNIDPPQAPAKLATEPDTTLFVVCGENFVNQDDAAEVALLISGKPRMRADWDYRIGSDFRYCNNAIESNVDVSTVRFYSADLYKRLKDDLEKYRTKKALYEERQREYTQVVDSRKEVVDTVWREIDAARRAVRELTENHSKYLRYLTLAENDKETALRFLCDALGISREAALEIADGPDKSATVQAGDENA